MRLVPSEYTCKFHMKLEEDDWHVIESILKLDEFEHLSSEEVQTIIERGKLKITHGGYNMRDYDTLSKSAFLGGQLGIYHELIAFMSANNVSFENDAWISDLKLRTMNMEKEISSVLPASVSTQTGAPMLSNSKTLEMAFIESFITRTESKANRESNPSNPRKFQAYFSSTLYNLKFKSKFSLTENHSFKWLCIDPSSTDTPVDNHVYTRMFRDSMNIHFVRKGTIRKCACGANLDSQEKHLKGCTCFGIKERHNNVVNIISKYLNSMHAKAISGEIPIDALAPILNSEEAYISNVNIDELRPNFVKENRSWIDESQAPSNSASSYSLIRNLVTSLSRSAITGTREDSLSDLGNNDNSSTSYSSTTYLYPSEGSSIHPPLRTPSINPSYTTDINPSDTVASSCLFDSSRFLYKDNSSSNSCSAYSHLHNTACPPLNSNHLGSSINNSNSNSSNLLSSKIFNSSASTKGTRIDIVTLAPWIRVMMDVTIVNNANLADHEYTKKFDSAEAGKIRMHLAKAQNQGYDYFVPIFSTDGSPSKNTKKTMQGYFRKYLTRLSPDQAKLVESYGNKSDYYLNLICFQIHRDNAEHANRLNLKLQQKNKSSSNLLMTSSAFIQHPSDNYLDADFTVELRGLETNRKLGRF